jgi:hypothetical protein
MHGAPDIVSSQGEKERQSALTPGLAEEVSQCGGDAIHQDSLQNRLQKELAYRE